MTAFNIEEDVQHVLLDDNYISLVVQIVSCVINGTLFRLSLHLAVLVQLDRLLPELPPHLRDNSTLDLLLALVGVTAAVWYL